MASVHASTAIADYLSRRPEKLLLDGMRQWAGGYETGCVDCWESAHDAFTRELGPRAAGAPLFCLARLVRGLRANAQRPFQTYPVNCRRICRDECCLMAMVASARDGDRECFSTAATALGLPEEKENLFACAAELGTALDENGLALLPVPNRVLCGILGLARDDA